MFSADEIRKAYEETQNSYMAAARLGISPTHFKRLMHKYGIPFVPTSVARRKPRLKWQPIPSADLAYVLGALKGDGHVTSPEAPNSNQNRILLEVTDWVFACSFRDALERIGLRPWKMRKSIDRRPHRKPRWVVTARSKAFAAWYRSLDLETMRLVIRGFEEHFIRGLYEAEGHLIVASPGDTDVVIGMADEALIRMVHSILASWGMHPTIHLAPDRRPGHKTVYRVMLSRQADVYRFFQRVRPCIKNTGYANPEPSWDQSTLWSLACVETGRGGPE